MSMIVAQRVGLNAMLSVRVGILGTRSEAETSGKSCQKTVSGRANQNGGPFDPPPVIQHCRVMKVYLPLARQRP
jgi:hypothetical protein